MKSRKNLIWLLVLAYVLVMVASCKAGDCNCPQF